MAAAETRPLSICMWFQNSHCCCSTFRCVQEMAFRQWKARPSGKFFLPTQTRESWGSLRGAHTWKLEVWPWRCLSGCNLPNCLFQFHFFFVETCTGKYTSGQAPNATAPCICDCELTCFNFCFSFCSETFWVTFRLKVYDAHCTLSTLFY